jgi:hypothetical protein
MDSNRNISSIPAPGASIPAPGSEPVGGHPGFRCAELNDRLVALLIERTHDPDDIRLREMTRDLARFSSEGNLAEWQPGRDLLCLEGEDGSLAGLAWIAEKPLPERDDYFDPGRLRELDPQLTCAIRTYGPARGRGLLTKAFAEHSTARLLRKRPKPVCIWYETKAANVWARALAKQMGFVEMSGDATGTVVGLRVFE